MNNKQKKELASKLIENQKTFTKNVKVPIVKNSDDSHLKGHTLKQVARNTSIIPKRVADVLIKAPLFVFQFSFDNHSQKPIKEALRKQNEKIAVGSIFGWTKAKTETFLLMGSNGNKIIESVPINILAAGIPGRNCKN